MSQQLIQVFLGDTPVHLDSESQAQDDPQLLWKVVLRTGTWKLRPGPGGVKLNAPLKIFRDQAPKGHISMSELVKNFDAGAKEYVTVPQVHVDGTTSDGGFVKKLVIQDVKGEDGSKTKESLLWAGLEITDSALKTKLDEKSIRGVSGGILFDYERTEDAKKFGQILSHVMVTNSPWIGGTGDFQSKLPEGVMASEPDDLPISEVEFASRETNPQPELPVVDLGDPPVRAEWAPQQGLAYMADKVGAALEQRRNLAMAKIPQSARYEQDWPLFTVADVSLAGDTGMALVKSGADAWIASFRFNDKDVELGKFSDWTPAKPEWVAAPAEQLTPSKPPPVLPAGRESPVRSSGLQEAQAARAERIGSTITTTNTGGNMGLSDLLSGVELSDEQREAIKAEEARVARLEADDLARREASRQAEVTAYCGDPSATDEESRKGLLGRIGLDDPGVKKYVRNALLSDDGGPAIELSEHLSDGQKTSGVSRTATELLKGFIDILPKRDDGKVSLSDQVRRLPDDPKPPAENDEKPADAKSSADALLAELHSQGLSDALVMPAKEA